AMSETAAAAPSPSKRSAVARAIDSDLFYSFRRSPITILSAVVACALVLSAVFASLIAPHNPFDPASLSIMDSCIPSVWGTDGDPYCLLVTSYQRGDVPSAVLYGVLISLAVGVSSVALAMVIGVTLGLLASY